MGARGCLIWVGERHERAHASDERAAGVVLGETYPQRLVTDLALAREETVRALLEMRAASLESRARPTRTSRASCAAS